MALAQSSANYGPWAKASPPPVPVQPVRRMMVTFLKDFLNRNKINISYYMKIIEVGRQRPSIKCYWNTTTSFFLHPQS